MKLLFAVLCPKPESRATITEIESSPWVKQPVDIKTYKWEEVIRNTEFHGNNAGDGNLDDEMKPMPRPKNNPSNKKLELKDNVKPQLNQQSAINLLMSKSF